MTEYRTYRTDRELVAAHLSGDPAALAAVYDRFAESLYDTARAMLSDSHDAEDLTQDVFVVAAKKLDQLRDPDRLRPWLFAILRHEVYRRSKQRKRARATDFDGSAVPEMAAAEDPRAEAAEVEVSEVAAFVREAATGLAERDQLILELSARHGLVGADLADALGVTQQQCHVLVHRMRERVQRSIGALTVARYGRRDCAALQTLLHAWDGTFDPRIRKRVAGHIDDCDVCEATSRKFAVIPLFSAAPAFAAPVGLRDRVLASTAGLYPSSDAAPTIVDAAGYRFEEVGGFPGAVRNARRLLVVGVIATVALLLLGGTWFAFADGDDTGGSPTTTATTPPTSTTTVPLAVTEPTTTIAQQAVTTSTTSTSIPTTSTSTTTTTTTTTTPTPTTATTTTTPTTTTTTTTTTAPQVIVPPTPAPPAPPTPAPPTPPPPTPAPRPGQLVLSASSIDLGATATPSQLRLANTGDLPLNWTITGNANPFLWSSTSGALAAGATVDVPVGIDRAALAEGDVVRNFTVTSSAAGTAPLTLRAAVEHPPVVQFVTAPTSLMCPGPSGSPVLVSVSDESSISGVQLIWTGPGPTGSASMMQIGSSWESLLGPDPVNGTWTWEARATDARGNVGSISAPFIVSGC